MKSQPNSSNNFLPNHGASECQNGKNINPNYYYNSNGSSKVSTQLINRLIHKNNPNYLLGKSATTPTVATKSPTAAIRPQQQQQQWQPGQQYD